MILENLATARKPDPENQKSQKRISTFPRDLIGNQLAINAELWSIPTSGLGSRLLSL